ncbi:MAG: glycosyltransferase family 87 protein [Opitutaceae bacterium]
MRNSASAAAATRLTLAGSISLVAWGALAWQSHTRGAPLGWALATLALAWAALAAALPGPAARDAKTIAIFGLGFRLVALFARPTLEDDHYRFLWDGYRFATTGNPYVEAPQASFGDATVPAAFREILDRINHPDVPTIYGPLTQWAFRFCHAVAPGKLWPWKLVLLGAELAIVALLWRELTARGRLLLTWCPLAIFETGFNAHPDALAIALLVAAWWLGRRAWSGAAGVAIGLAMAAKVFAVLLAPFILWRLRRRGWVVAAATAILLYVPFWLRGSAADFAGLRAMAGEWEFNSSVYAVAAWLVSPAVAHGICGLAFGAIWLAIFLRWMRTNRESLPPGEWVYGGFLLLSAVANPWYALWLWPFVAMRPSATGIAALAAVSLAYVTGLNLGAPSLGNFGHPGWLRPVEFGLVGCGALLDWRKSRTRP